jgi:carboxymethylenebutenolidase
MPAIVVIQEIWGVAQHIQDIVERFANAGYVALAPDLYSAGGGRPPALQVGRIDEAKAFMDSIPPADWMTILSNETLRNKELSKLPNGEGPRVAETMDALFGRASGASSRDLEMLVSAVGFLGSHQACEGRAIGAVGFCMGGGLSAQLACSDANIDAAAIFYGASPAADQISKIRCPIRGFYGRNDPNIVSGLRGFAEELEKARIDYELRIYPDTPHAFFNDTRPSYRQEAARDAWARLLAFFAVSLGSVPTVSAMEAENPKEP